MIGTETIDDIGAHEFLDLIEHQACELYDHFYFAAEYAKHLFADLGVFADGVTTLHGEAAIEYAARHGRAVQYAELREGDYLEGYPIEISPGQARERMPETRERWISIVAPCDLVTDDLPPSGRPWDLRYKSEELTAEELRNQAVEFRKTAEWCETKAARLEGAAGRDDGLEGKQRGEEGDA